MARKRGSKLVECIWGCAQGMGLTTAELCKTVMIPDSTLRRRKKDPGTFTVRELETIGRRLGIPAEELREAALRY